MIPEPMVRSPFVYGGLSFRFHESPRHKYPPSHIVLMTTTKVLAAIGLMSIIAFAGVCVMLMSTGGGHSNDSGSSPAMPDVYASTDGLSKSEIQATLQHYAALQNTSDDKTHYLVVSGSVRSTGSNGVAGDCMINVAPGSAIVSDGELVLSGLSETYYNSYSGYHSSTTVYACDYVVPYHSIVGIKLVKQTSHSYN